MLESFPDEDDEVTQPGIPSCMPGLDTPPPSKWPQRAADAARALPRWAQVLIAVATALAPVLIALIEALRK